MGFPSAVRLPTGVYPTDRSYGSSCGRLAGRPSPEEGPVHTTRPTPGDADDTLVERRL
ncbi:hypothetical protein ABT255_43275 [Streptomyces mirabilis]|uniref:hypothetical protein n=1 Tax=Streptomyces mirabilis TaxID=68239 RepID=UPI00332F59D4